MKGFFFFLFRIFCVQNTFFIHFFVEKEKKIQFHFSKFVLKKNQNSFSFFL